SSLIPCMQGSANRVDLRQNNYIPGHHARSHERYTALRWPQQSYFLLPYRDHSRSHCKARLEQRHWPQNSHSSVASNQVSLPPQQLQQTLRCTVLLLFDTMPLKCPSKNRETN